MCLLFGEVGNKLVIDIISLFRYNKFIVYIIVNRCFIEVFLYIRLNFR